MKVGILALALIFFMSGVKNIQDSNLFSRSRQTDSGQGIDADVKEQLKYSKRKLGFGIMLSFVGLLVLIYYIIII